MTTFYGRDGVAHELSVKMVFRGLASHYNTHGVEETVRTAYAGFYTPSELKHANGKISNSIIDLNGGIVPYFMGVLYFTHVMRMDLYQ